MQPKDYDEHATGPCRSMDLSDPSVTAEPHKWFLSTLEGLPCQLHVIAQVQRLPKQNHWHFSQKSPSGTEMRNSVSYVVDFYYCELRIHPRVLPRGASRSIQPSLAELWVHDVP